MTVVFLDTETTGLDPERHELWDIGLVFEDGHEWNPHPKPARLEDADPTALRLTHFYDRAKGKGWTWGNRADVAGILAETLAEKHIVGAVPSFDAAFLERFLRAHGYSPAWHYHLVDVEALAAGKIGAVPPWDSESLSRSVGVEPDAYERHTALGDARWARALYLAVLG